MKLHVGCGAYICSEKKFNGCWFYLRKDGTLGTSLRGEKDWFEIERKAQQFLDNWMPRKKKLATYDIQYYSTLGEMEALDCSIEHWKQNVLDVEQAHLGSSHCAICLRAAEKRDKLIESWRNGVACPYCILNNYANWDGNCCKEYQDFTRDKTEENAIAMLNKLVLIRNKKYGNPYKQYNVGIDLAKEKKMTKEMTVAQVAKELGYDVKIVKESVKPKPPKWKHGDVVETSSSGRRIILEINGCLKSFDKTGDCMASNEINGRYVSVKDGAAAARYQKLYNVFSK